MFKLVSLFNLLPDWIAAVVPNQHIAFLVIGISFFMFGVSRRKS